MTTKHPMIVVAAALTHAWLLGLCVLAVQAERLAKPGSTHPSFPMDAFAKPTFKILYDDTNPISNQTALDMLQWSDEAATAADVSSSRPETAVGEYKADGTTDGSERPSFEAYLHRSSPTSLHLCSVAHAKQEALTRLHLDESSLRAHRVQVVQNALKLLSPLKDTCLFHTLEWFTYSLCYGDAIKQFRALPPKAGGVMTPAADPSQDSYVLGRWNEGIEAIKELEQPKSPHPQSDEVQEAQGTELMELVHFSSLDGIDTERGRSEEDHQVRSHSTVEGKGRYISQVWTDGTRCNINNEMRTTEVQFHCSKSPPIDRISFVKEVTTCSYVVVVDTPKLCEEPALAQVEDEVREVRCQPIVSDEELERRLSEKKAAINGESLPSKSPALETEEGTAGEDNDAQKSGREDVRASLQSIVKRLNSAAGDVASDIEVIVGWDEDGRFILEEKAQGQETDVEKLLDVSSSQEDKQEAGGDAKAKDRWDLLLQKLLDLEDQIFDAAETHDALQETPGELGSGQSATPPEQATVTKADGSPSRTDQMIRKTENFAQKVERFYKAQEAQKENERKDEDAGGGPRMERDRDEL